MFQEMFNRLYEHIMLNPVISFVIIGALCMSFVCIVVSASRKLKNYWAISTFLGSLFSLWQVSNDDVFSMLNIEHEYAPTVYVLMVLMLVAALTMSVRSTYHKNIW